MAADDMRSRRNTRCVYRLNLCGIRKDVGKLTREQHFLFLGELQMSKRRHALHIRFSQDYGHAEMLTSALVTQQSVRRAVVAGSWYPGTADALGDEVDRYLGAVSGGPRGDVTALIAPHAGLMYSGPVAAHAYNAVKGHAFDVAVLVGPSHHVAFEGVSIYPRGAFDTPLGAVPVSAKHADDLMARSGHIRAYPAAHASEHSLEIQLPFLRRILPDTPIVPLVMGYQTSETIVDLADALAAAFGSTRVLLVASTDLSHYFDARAAAQLDGRVVDFVGRFDVEGFLKEFESYPEFERGRFVACGGGPAIAVMHAARALGARDARVLKYADSGDISGDKSAVVGYMAAAFGRFE